MALTRGELSCIELDIKNTVIELIGDLKSSVFTRDNEQTDMLAVEVYFENLSPKSITDNIVKYLLPHSEHIKSRNESFFKTQRELFEGLPTAKINYYSGVLSDDKRLVADDKEVMWDYFTCLLTLAEKYKKRV